MVLDINEGELKDKLKGKCLVDFYTTWCGPCKMMAPVLEEVSKEISDVAFLKIDVEDNMQAGADYGISTVPTLILFEDGVEVDRFSGFMAKEKLVDFVRN